MFKQCLRGEPHRFREGFLGDAAVPLLDNLVPGHPLPDHVRHVLDKNPRPDERELPVTDSRVGHEMPTKELSFHDHPLLPRAACSDRTAHRPSFFPTRLVTTPAPRPIISE